MSKTGRPGGNPDFGNKYKFPTKEKEAFTAQLNARVHSETRQKISEIAKSKGMSVPDLMRQIVYEYLAQQDKITA